MKIICKLLGVTIASIGLITAVIADNQNGIYLGADAGGLISSSGTTNGATFRGTIGYQDNKYSAVQFTGMYGGHDNGLVMFESLWMLPITKYVTPYLTVGAGYTHLSGNSIGGEVGGGIRINLSANLSISANYRLIQALGSKTPTTNMIDGGVTFFFGNDNYVPYTDTQPTSTRNVNDSDAIGPTESQSMSSNYDSQPITEITMQSVVPCGDEGTTIACYAYHDDQITLSVDSDFYSGSRLSSETLKGIEHLVSTNQFNHIIINNANGSKDNAAYYQLAQKFSNAIGHDGVPAGQISVNIT